MATWAFIFDWNTFVNSQISVAGKLYRKLWTVWQRPDYVCSNEMNPTKIEVCLKGRAVFIHSGWSWSWKHSFYSLYLSLSSHLNHQLRDQKKKRRANTGTITTLSKIGSYSCVKIVCTAAVKGIFVHLFVSVYSADSGWQKSTLILFHVLLPSKRAPLNWLLEIP